MKRYIFIPILFIFSLLVNGQTGTIKGRVFNAVNNEPLPFVNIVITGTTIGSTSDYDGNFIFAGIKPGFYKLTVSSVGFEKKMTEEIQVINAKATSIDVPLNELTIKLNLVDVTASRFLKKEESLVSIRTIGVSEIENNPGANRDISKVIQSFPGVATTPANRNDVIVRGGGSNESRFYLDDVEIPNINHFTTQGASGGSNGILNADFIREVNFYSGGFPAAKGNAISAVFNFKQIDGNKDKLKFRGTLGASEISLTADGPLTDNTTFILSARRSYLNFLFKVLGLPFLPTFNDYQLKTRTRFNEKNELTVISVGALDNSKLDLDIKNPDENQRYILNFLPEYYQWSYTIGAVYKHFFKKGYHTFVASRNMLNNSSLKYKNNIEEDSLKTLDYSSDEIENKFRYENTIRFDNGYKINTGASFEFAKYTNNTFQKYYIPATGEGIIRYNSLLEMFKWGIFAQISKSYFEDRFTASIGVRTDAASYSSSTSNMLDQLSPRISLLYLLSEKFSIIANTGRYYQLPAYTTLGFRDENGLLINKQNNIKYISSDHFISGIEYRPKDDSKITVEGFYKLYNQYPFSISDSISLSNRSADFGAVGNEAVVSISEGRAYGAEFLCQYRFPKDLNLVLSYTFVRSEFKDKMGEYVPSSWDSRHLFILTASKKFKKDWSVGLKWRFAGGLPYTPYDFEKSELIAAWDLLGRPYLDFSNVNSLRFKPFHQLDLRIDKTWFMKTNTLKLYFDIQNAYNFKSEEQDRITNKDVNGVPQINPSDPTKYLLRALENNGSGTVLPTIGIIFDF